MATSFRSSSFKGILLSDTLGMDVSTFGYWHQFIFVAVVLITQALLNHYGIGLTTKITDISGYLIFVLSIILIIGLLLVWRAAASLPDRLLHVTERIESAQVHLFERVPGGKFQAPVNVTSLDDPAVRREEEFGLVDVVAAASDGFASPGGAGRRRCTSSR